MVAYELMNEPVADDPEDWNKIVNECYSAVRELEKERVIVIGSNMWQSYNTTEQLALPDGDPNIILSFHYYEPMVLTHYQAGWTELKDYGGPVNYPGQCVTEEQLAARPAAEQEAYAKWTKENYSKERFAADFSIAANVAKRHGIQVYCGEYGCINSSPEADRNRWFRDMEQTFEEKSIGRAVWDYKGGFGIIKGGKPDETMIRILTGKENSSK